MSNNNQSGGSYFVIVIVVLVMLFAIGVVDYAIQSAFGEVLNALK
jgi:preprotein translocase subunit SecE